MRKPHLRRIPLASGQYLPGSQGTRKEVIKERDDNMGQGGGNEGSEEWSDFGYIWKVEPTRLAYGLDERNESKRGVKEDST